ncbi:MAG: bifunctional phosphoribosylaminoimidazolecarboxamide formyltransferase/IMP cyclohydrolase [Candidatus Omnitrophica bacterium]|nr:bifunctional phosphoribosylaminoimidazolecarboxamide formyltransferase/IMP cyclohydrolase [Candidatus Omnitrophota bacterium]
MIKVKRALISVSDKGGLVPFAQGLARLGIEIISTGGTSRILQEAGIEVKEVSDFTGFPEMLDGRVKTLHPKIHAGLLAIRSNEEHMQQLKKHRMKLIDMVVVNLYPFESVIQKKRVAFEAAIENIDIGGPTMLRAAAKNFNSVAVVCNPGRYDDILTELENKSGLLSDTVLFSLAVETFKHTASYDNVIAEYLGQCQSMDDFGSMPANVSWSFAKIQDLRYGENPHQSGAFYSVAGQKKGLASLRQLHGKELSFNNILDLHATVACVREFENPAAVIIKHNNATGVAEDKFLTTAFQNALKCDPVSAFGGIIGLNRSVDEKTAQLIVKSGFMECVIAPSFQKAALKVLTRKKNLRLLTLDFRKINKNGYDFKQVFGGLLLQDRDERALTTNELKFVTKKKPTRTQLDAIMFGWKVVKHIRSNAIILVKGQKTVGIGCGQTSRVESVRIAIHKAGAQAQNATLISDAFIPKTDNVDLAAQAGIKLIVQTGGSIADKEVIAAADKAGVAIVMTGVRHFKH